MKTIFTEFFLFIIFNSCRSFYWKSFCLWSRSCWKTDFLWVLDTIAMSLGRSMWIATDAWQIFQNCYCKWSSRDPERGAYHQLHLLPAFLPDPFIKWRKNSLCPALYLTKSLHLPLTKDTSVSLFVFHTWFIVFPLGWPCWCTRYWPVVCSFLFLRDSELKTLVGIH